MKTSILSTLLFFIVTISSAQMGIFYAVVNNDSVTIHNDSSEWICAAVFEFDIEVDGYLVNLYENDVQVVFPYCLCLYNLSATIAPLEPGSYQADVYRTVLNMGSDTTYAGTVYFEIEGKKTTTNAGIVSTYASDCLPNTTGINEPNKEPLLIIYPNPSSESVELKFADRINEMNEIIIFDQLGKTIFQSKINTMEESIIWNGNDLTGNKVNSGFYFIRINTNYGSYTTKLIRSQ
ncbi:MAG: T9SS type A sorting domain-containing protein [Bacteroidetes bacterium]|nr:T9SS type A sorting domain-containing protein [Bacteroidota bacterium]